jgi:crossover junction endodeoxyribonuclease RuvC
MNILGVDPGTLITGFGLISVTGGRVRTVACGAIRTRPADPMPERLHCIFSELQKVILRHKPDELAIETAFYGKNAQSALKLGHARGVAMLAAVLRGIPVHEYSPREVKKAVAGVGTASKEQVQYMVSSMLNLREEPETYDVTDALAVALCHLHRKSHAAPKRSGGWSAWLKDHPERIAAPSRRTATP